ncbi:DUF3280 domain-containing protein [Chenggangzhangella methanolivorans]|uniref:DUF3280 domain-containing protein n=2 Tax=Chenggangzhangella methanolivorans TaxID=1437009 RepID=A0A9E6RK64_9HYPH|nr:DUF3280 domain-containing protein [Chenggangzhangella methanolivorans]
MFSGGHAVAAPAKAAVFPFEFIDSSQEGESNGPRQDETDRVKRVAEQVAEFLRKGSIDVVDATPAQAGLKDVKSLKDCIPCATKAAGAVGADLVVVGHIQKVSNLILNINVQIVDVKTGKTVRGGSADIRGNTQETWDHGTKYLMTRNILKDPMPEAGAL